MGIPVLKVNKREGLGKNFSRRSRRSGFIPSVVYGIENKHLDLEEAGVLEVLRNYGQNATVELDDNGNVSTVMVKEVQRNPVGGAIYHIDFMPIDFEKKVSAKIPISYFNTSVIKSHGGIIQSQKDYLEVTGKSKDIPQSINIDLSKHVDKQILKVKDIEIASELSFNENIENIVASFNNINKFLK